MHRRVRNYLLILLTLVSLSCSGCLSPAPPEATPSATDFTDQLGRLVRLEKTPERIVSLDPANAEILFALGLGDRVVAVTDESDYPPEVETKPTIGSISGATAEKIAAFSPDLVLATSSHQEKLIPELEQQGIPVFGLEPKSIDEVLAAITLVGDITRQQDTASQLVAELRSRVKTVTDKIDRVHSSQRPRVFYLIWHSPVWTAGSGTLQDDLIETAGGVNIARGHPGYWGISLNEVAHANPQVMIAPFYINPGLNMDLPYQFLLTEPRLGQTDANQDGRVYTMWGVTLDRAGPRIVDALEELAILIYLRPQGIGERI